MFSHACGYAIRAATHIAIHALDAPLSATRIATDTGIPPAYVRQILHTLVRNQILASGRGLHGGFRLKRPADEIRLLDIALLFEPERSFSACPFSNPRCADAHPCPLRGRLGSLLAGCREFLERTTLADLADCGPPPLPGTQ